MSTLLILLSVFLSPIQSHACSDASSCGKAHAEAKFGGGSCNDHKRFLSKYCGGSIPTGRDLVPIYEGINERGSGVSVRRLSAWTMTSPPSLTDPSIEGSARRLSEEARLGADVANSLASMCQVKIDRCKSSCSGPGSSGNDDLLMAIGEPPAPGGPASQCLAYQANVDKLRTEGENYSIASAKALSIANGTGAGDTPGKDPNGGPGGPGDETAQGGTQPQSADGGGAGAGGAGGGNPLSQLMGALAQAMQPKPKQEDPRANEKPDCQRTPTLAGCKPPGTEAQSWNKDKGEAGFNDEGNGKTADDFNVGNTNPGPSVPTEPGERQFGQPASVSAVPNGGGGMPGGGGGGAASLGGGATTGGFGIPNASKTNVLQGERGGGGYSQTLAAMKDMQGGQGGGGFSGYGGGNGSGIERGMDLRQFLPGGAKDPARKLAGTASPQNMQIQSATTNIWNRVTERIRTRCAQGLLRDCIP